MLSAIFKEGKTDYISKVISEWKYEKKKIKEESQDYLKK